VPAAVRALFARKLLKTVAEAYGRMLLIKGLFQADCHPGNILIRDDNSLGEFSDKKESRHEITPRAESLPA
jgi:aarF domain-containing kinase